MFWIHAQLMLSYLCWCIYPLFVHANFYLILCSYSLICKRASEYLTCVCRHYEPLKISFWLSLIVFWFLAKRINFVGVCLKEDCSFLCSFLNYWHCHYLIDTGTKTLRQLQAEEDDEERFQADLKRAVRQSLGVSLLLLSCSYLCFNALHFLITSCHLLSLF